MYYYYYYYMTEIKTKRKSTRGQFHYPTALPIEIIVGLRNTSL